MSSQYNFAGNATVVNPKSVRRYIRYLGTIVTGPQIVGVTVAGVKKSV